ncbi:helix-turn-helix domain-containing protein [Nocardiopsis changdeensis]|uniref:helix-turn-helix domain-containing protein n=2 Tax=Nocardiopsis changdeensis TaxID=2831969 RepID=UPI003B9DBEF6
MDQAGPREELSERLDTARLRSGLTKEQLRARAGLSRTTVSNALNGTGPLPTKETITALARALGLEPGPLLELRRKAADPPGQVGAVAAPGSAPPDLPAPDPSTHAANTIIGDLSHSTVIQAHTAIISPPNPPAPAPRPAPGRPIGECDPHDLEMRVAGSPPTSPAATVSVPQRDTARLPGYVRRDHDDVLDRAVRAALGGSSRMVVLVGLSSTGKTRACWEAVQPLAEHGWRLWHPFDPTRAEAALEGLGRVGPRTVVWLNESQHYLAHPRFGEQIAAALHVLLTNPARGPVLVLGTLWKKYCDALTAQPDPGHQDAHAQARALLEGRQVTVPVAFTNDQLDNARELAQSGDGQLAHALEHVRDGRLAQTLAGAPELVRRYETASPGARALLNAAMDARRLGVSLHLPLGFLVQAAEGYLTDDELDALPDQWVDQALEEAGTVVHGGQAPLRLVRTRRSDQTTSTAQGPVYRLEDYLEQHANHTRREKCPPASFWHAVEEHLTDPDDLYILVKAARNRGLLWHAVRLSQRAILARHPRAALLAVRLLLPETDPDQHGAGWIAAHTVPTDPDTAAFLLEKLHNAGQEQAVKELASRAAAHANLTQPYAAASLLKKLRDAGQEQAVKELASRAAVHADLTNPSAVAFLLEKLRDAGQEQAVKELASRAAVHADLTNPSAVASLLEVLHRMRQGQAVTALLARNPAVHADLTQPHAVASLLEVLHRMRQGQAVTALLARNPAVHADLTDPSAVISLVEGLRDAGQVRAAKELASRAAAHVDLTDPRAVAFLLEKLRDAGQEQATAALLARNPAVHADLSHPGKVFFLVGELRDLGQARTAKELASRAAVHADLTDPGAVGVLLELLRHTGQEQAMEELASRAAVHADLTDPSAVASLLRDLHGAGQGQAVAALLARNPAVHANLTDPVAVNFLLKALRDMGQEQALEELASRAAIHADLTNPSPAGSLLVALHQTGQAQAAEEVASRAAAHADLTHPHAVASLLGALHRTGQAQAAEELAARAAVHTNIHAHDVASLLEELHRTGQEQSAAKFERRVLDAGGLAVPPPSLWPYGRHPDGSPAGRWTWEEPRPRP